MMIQYRSCSQTTPHILSCHPILLSLSPFDQCGRAETHRINFNNISVPLLCAVRVTVMNETDVDVLCPRVQ